MSKVQKSVLQTRLRNGLEVRLKEVHTAPLISSWLWYRVGSRYEYAGITGISHWVEHMQFKGTPNFPAGVLDRAISRDGGLPILKLCLLIVSIWRFAWSQIVWSIVSSRPRRSSRNGR